MPSNASAAGQTANKVDAHKPPAAPTDALNLPLPPVTLDFAIRGDAVRDGFFQRYTRKGNSQDATTAVVGKGGFGTAYRFVRDDSFTPPTSMMDTSASSGDGDLSVSKEQSKRRSCQMVAGVDSRSESDANGSSTGQLPWYARNIAANDGRYLRSPGSVPPSPNLNHAKIGHTRQTVSRSKAPAVVVVKVCRTPTSGSYDELPKTGIGRTEAKLASQEVLSGNPIGEHTRIVRGEARLLRYLQMCQIIERVKSHQSHVVRLLADVPMPRPTSNGDDNAMQVDDKDENYSGPPVPRLLVFERLVDLDAELTPRGWARSKQLWSIGKVESAAKDAICGLRFLHEHHVVHGDLKPSNFMRDARTGVIKLIDLGASRRWVRLHNVAKERTTAVEELDQAVKEGFVDLPRPGDVLCEGLGSLTGSPHFMAPEVLLQAGRYLAADGLARNVLDDYSSNKNRLPRHPSASLLSWAHADFKRGWGIKADVWSWGCSVLSLLLRTIESKERPSSNTVCAFDFSFENDADALPPLWPLHTSNDSLPRFHQWARLHPLRIMATLHRGVSLPEYANVLSGPFLQMLQAAFTHQDSRPSSTAVTEFFDSQLANNVEYMSDVQLDLPTRPASRAQSIALSVRSISTAGASMPDEPHNVDLSVSSSVMGNTTSQLLDSRQGPSTHNLIAPQPIVAGRIGTPPVAFEGGPQASPQAIRNHQAQRLAISTLSSPHSRSSRSLLLSNTSPLPTEEGRVRQSHPQQMSALVANEIRMASPRRDSIGSNASGRPASPALSGRSTVSTPLMEMAKPTALSRSTCQPNCDFEGDVEEMAGPQYLVEREDNHVIDAMGQPASLRSKSSFPTSKSKRTSIFNRVASTFGARPHVRKSSAPSISTAYGVHPQSNTDAGVSASQLSLLMKDKDVPFSRHWDANPSSPNAYHSQADLSHMSNQTSQQTRKSTGNNLLGLELGHVLQAPLRTVRSLASVRGGSTPPFITSVGEDRESKTRTASRANGAGTPGPSRLTTATPSSPERYAFPTNYSEGSRHTRVASVPKLSNTQPYSPTQLRQNISGDYFNQSEGANGDMSQSPATMSTNPYLLGQGVAGGMQSVVPSEYKQRRQRSWSVFFKRNKRA